MLFTLKEDLIVFDVFTYTSLDALVKNMHFNILEFTTLP